MKLNQIIHIKPLLVLVLALERKEGFLLFLSRLFKLEREFFILVPNLCIFTFLQVRAQACALSTLVK